MSLRARHVLGIAFVLIVSTLVTAAPPPQGFLPQVRVGFSVGDQWEPAIATDRLGNVFVLYPQYGDYPGCPTCPNPTMALVISNDGGRTWNAPRLVGDPGTGQWDAQIVVDPLDGKTLYAAYLVNRKSQIAVAKSVDSGKTWTVAIANSTKAGTDKPILMARGQDVYVGYNHSQKVWVSASHDGGATFTSYVVNPNGKLGWSLAGGGAVDNSGNVYFGWAGYEQNGGAKGAVNLFISKSTDGGVTWTNKVLEVSGAPPDCSAYSCGWAYLGAQVTLAMDSAGALYALWNSGATDKAPERMYFARSSDGGNTWSPRQDVSGAAVGVAHAFPAIAAAGPGDVRIAWMDARNHSLWNVYYRSSKDGGATWSTEQDISSFASGYDYIQLDGFSYPFGDYFEIDIDSQGKTHAVFGEGLNYVTPGSVWYTNGN
jgi:hypothetical protein